MNVKTAILICLATLFNACSRLPSESDARAAVEQKLQKHAKGLVRLASFRKTNGLKIDAFAGYTVQYAGEVEFLADCVWDAQELSATAGRKSKYDRNELVEKHKGERAQVDNGVFFSKTENGWLPTE